MRLFSIKSHMTPKCGMKKAAHEQQASVSPYMTSSNCVAMTHDYENCFEDAFQLRSFKALSSPQELFLSRLLIFFFFQTAPANYFFKVLTFLVLNYPPNIFKTAPRNIIEHVSVL